MSMYYWLEYYKQWIADIILIGMPVTVYTRARLCVCVCGDKNIIGSFGQRKGWMLMASRPIMPSDYRRSLRFF